MSSIVTQYSVPVGEVPTYENTYAMFNEGGTFYFLTVNAANWELYQAPANAQESFVLLHTADLPVGFVAQNAQIFDKLGGSFLFAIAERGVGQTKAIWIEATIAQLSGDDWEINDVKEIFSWEYTGAASDPDNYYPRLGRCAFGATTSHLYGTFADKYTTYNLRKAGGTVETFVPTGDTFARQTTRPSGYLRWVDENARWEYYTWNFLGSGGAGNISGYLCTMTPDGVGAWANKTINKRVNHDAFLQDGVYYIMASAQYSTYVRTVPPIGGSSSGDILATATESSVSGMGYSRLPQMYGDASGYRAVISTKAFEEVAKLDVWAAYDDHTATLEDRTILTYTNSLRVDAGALPLIEAPFSYRGYKAVDSLTDFGFLVASTLGKKDSTALTVGSAVGDVTQNFWLPPASVSLLEPKLYGRGDASHHPYQPSAYWVSPDRLYSNKQHATVDNQGWESKVSNNGSVFSWEPPWLLDPTGQQSGQTTEVSSRRGCLPILYATDTTFVYAYHNHDSPSAYIFRYDTVAKSHTTLLTVPSAGTNNTDGYEYLQVGGQLNNKTANGVWICTTFSGDYNFWVEDGGDTLTPIASDDPTGRLSGKTGATPVAGGHGDFLFSFRQGWWTNCTYTLDGIGTVLSVSFNKGQSWTEISYTPENASDSTGRITSAAMMGKTLYYTQYKTATTVALYKYDVANTQPVEVMEVEPTMHLPMTEYNNSLSSLIGAYSHRTYYTLSAAGLITFPIEDISSATGNIASASYREGKPAYNSEYGAVLHTATVALPSNGNPFAIRADRIPDRSVLMEGWMGRSDRVDDWQWLPSETPVWTPPVELASYLPLDTYSSGVEDLVTGAQLVETTPFPQGISASKDGGLDLGSVYNSNNLGSMSTQVTAADYPVFLESSGATTNLSFTMSCWFKLNGSVAGAPSNRKLPIIALKRQNDTGVFALNLKQNDSVFVSMAGFGGGHNFQPTLDTWYHICIVYKPNGSSTVSVPYRNGANVSSSQTSGFETGYTLDPAEVLTLAIGAEAEIADPTFNYNIDDNPPVSLADVRLYNVELTATEIADLYALGRNNF